MSGQPGGGSPLIFVIDALGAFAFLPDTWPHLRGS